MHVLNACVTPAGMSAQEAARQVSTCSDKVAQRTQAQLKDFTSSVSCCTHLPFFDATGQSHAIPVMTISL